MRNLLVVMFLITLSWVTWKVWVPALPPPTPAAVDVYVTPPPYASNKLWQVLTHRMVWKQGVNDLQRKLSTLGLSPKLMVRKERVELYVFNDARTFHSLRDVKNALAAWHQRGIKDVDIIVLKQEHAYTLALGRYYIMEYAQKTERQLQQSGLPYTQSRRTLNIPAMRFVFPPMSRSQANILWGKLQNLGLSQPVMIQADEFQRRYGDEGRTHAGVSG